MEKEIELIYNGYYSEIEFPGVRKEILTKDFSWGFYCTKIKEQAEEWADKFNTSIVNVYEMKDINALNVREFEDYSDEWLEFVVKCRSGEIHGYDIVIGPMADDTIYECIESYTQGKMNKKKFFEIMKLKYPNNQISFHTIKALDCISYIESYQIK